MPPTSHNAILPTGTGAVRVFWEFSRPHTMVATVLSVLSLYAVAAFDLRLTASVDLCLTIIAACAVNVFIVGLNQLTDIDIDRINKPYLPLPAGTLSTQAARTIVIVSAAVAIGITSSQDAVAFTAAFLGLVIGGAYSLPPLRLKRFPIAACGCIVLVRGVIVNAGIWLHFCIASGSPGFIHPAVFALIAAVVPFSLGIAVLKDIPDIEGDRRCGISTFPIQQGSKRVLVVGAAVAGIGILTMAVLGALQLRDANRAILVVGEIAAFAALFSWTARVRINDKTSVSAFYMRVWLLFFLQYALVAGAYTIR